MEINHDHNTIALSPAQRLAKIFVCALYVRIAWDRAHRPVSDGDPHKVDAVARHLSKVTFGNPAAPVSLESAFGFAAAKSLAEGVLCGLSAIMIPCGSASLTINDVLRSRLKDGRRYPRLKDEPSSKIYTSDLLAAEVELQTITTFELGHQARRCSICQARQERDRRDRGLREVGQHHDGGIAGWRHTK